MKKFLLTLCLLTVLAFTVQAQTRLGAGLAWGSDVEDLGLGINGEFFVKENISINPGLIFYFVDDRGNDRLDWWELNINGNFYFAQEGSVAFYGIGGLNLTTVAIENDFVDDSDTELGINLGIGSNFDVGGSVMPYAELKYVLGDWDQLVLFFGAKFNLN